jgi:4-diphosphocytidyl-2-C-methyl-D-erythritol kinase
MVEAAPSGTRLQTAANGKINLCLLLGPLREDGYHDVVSVIQPLDLADTVSINDSPSGSDTVVCPGVEGDNLAARAIASWREATGISDRPVEVTIEKRVPVAAGMGGGSADAAATLRLLDAFFGVEGASLVTGLGADVPPLLRGGPTLVSGIGDRVRSVPQPAFGSCLVLPSTAGLSTPRVFTEAGEMGMRRSPAEIVQVLTQLDHAADSGEGWDLPDALLGLNDLGPAAARLEPSVGEALEQARVAGADQAFVTGSGPTVVALFHGADGDQRAKEAAESLSDRPGGAIFSAASPASATIEQVA